MTHPGADEGKKDVVLTTDFSDVVVTEKGIRPFMIEDVLDVTKTNQNSEPLKEKDAPRLSYYRY